VTNSTPSYELRARLSTSSFLAKSVVRSHREPSVRSFLKLMTRTSRSRPRLSSDLLKLITRPGESVTDMNGGEDLSLPVRCLMKFPLLIAKSSADCFLQPGQQIPSSPSYGLALKSWWRRYKILIESSAVLLVGKNDRLWYE